MHLLMNAMLLVGAILLIAGIVIAFRAFIETRRKSAAPFRGYFGPRYDRELPQLSLLSEEEAQESELQSRVAPFYLGEIDVSRRFTPVSRAAPRNRERS